MKRKSIFFPWLWLLLSLCALGVIATSSHYMAYTAEMELMHKRTKLTTLERRADEKTRDNQLFESIYPDFVAAKKNGYIGAAHRLSWIETLLKAANEIDLPAMAYDIAPPKRAYQPTDDQNLSYSLYVSDMNLDLGLLHEGDLTAFFSYLDRYAEGLYTVSRCTLRPAVPLPPMVSSPDETIITTNCVLQWFTFEIQI